MEVRIKVRIDGGDDAGATRHDAGTTTTRGSDQQGRRRGGDAATTGRRMRKDQSTFSATGLSECSSGKLLLVDCLNEDDHGRVPRVHDRSSIHRSGPGPTGADDGADPHSDPHPAFRRTTPAILHYISILTPILLTPTLTPIAGWASISGSRD